MKSVARSMTPSVLIVALVVAPLPAARAGTLTGGATEWTQIANMVQLIQQTVSAIQQVMALQRQIKYWAQSTRAIGSPAGAFAIFQGFDAILRRVQHLLFAGGSIAERWAQTHPGRKTAVDAGFASAPELYQAIEEDTRKAVARSLEVLDIQGDGPDGWQKDKAIFGKLQTKMQTVGGQLEASMTANELLLEIIRQLQLMRQVQIAQAEMMGYHVSRDVQRRQLSEREMQERFRYTGRYREDGALGASFESW
jgi:P-type conjugative transfer protein TrbJ